MSGSSGPTAPTSTSARPARSCVQGPHVMPGYWGLPEETAAVLRRRLVPHRRRRLARRRRLRLHRRPHQGHDHLGRREHLPRRGRGRCCSSHPDIAECAVIGVPDEQVGRGAAGGRRARATAPRPTPTSCWPPLAGRLAKYKIPKSVVFADGLPRTASGKLLKSRAAQRATAPTEEGQPHEPSPSTASTNCRSSPAATSAPATGSRSPRSASTPSPTPPATTSGSTSTPSAPRPRPVRRRRSRTATSRSRCSSRCSPSCWTSGRQHGVNYGLNKVRFPAPVKVGSRSACRPSSRTSRRSPAACRSPSTARSRSRAAASRSASPSRSSASTADPQDGALLGVLRLGVLQDSEGRRNTPGAPLRIFGGPGAILLLFPLTCGPRTSPCPATAPSTGPTSPSSASTAATSDDPASYADADVVIARGALRRRHVAPAGHPVRAAGDPDDRLPAARRLAARAWRCAPTGCATCACSTPATSRCSPATSRRRCPRSRPPSRRWPAPARSRSSSAATTRSPSPDAKGVANVLGHGRVSMIHFDAHADTGDIEFGSLWGHGQPMRRLIESGALRGDRFLQIGLRGYWPPPETLDWMAEQRMRSYEMTEIGAPRAGRRASPRRSAIATDECEGVFLSVDIDVCDPGARAGHRHARAGRADRPPAARRRPPDLPGAPGRRGGRRRGQPALRPRRHHRGAGQPRRPRGAVRDRPPPPGRPRRHHICRRSRIPPGPGTRPCPCSPTARHPEDARMTAHPLDPLTADEFRAAAAVLRRDRASTSAGASPRSSCASRPRTSSARSPPATRSAARRG